MDDTARAALLALGEYERSHSPRSLALARRWLSFVEYMQYPDGSLANFIRSPAGVRNATGPTSVRGGYWWSARAKWALARAYRLTRDRRYLERYLACKLPPTVDGKINAVLALAAMELHRGRRSAALRGTIQSHCATIMGRGDAPYFLDHPDSDVVHLWGYHQLHAMAAGAALLERQDWLSACRRTIKGLIEPDIRACFWYDYPARRKNGMTAYCVAPIVQGLGAMYGATGADRYRKLAVTASNWFYGRNDAHVQMYDPATGMCRDGIQNGIASENYGAESAIEAGFSELRRRELLRAQ